MIYGITDFSQEENPNRNILFVCCFHWLMIKETALSSLVGQKLSGQKRQGNSWRKKAEEIETMDPLPTG